MHLNYVLTQKGVLSVLATVSPTREYRGHLLVLNELNKEAIMPRRLQHCGGLRPM